LAVPGRDRPLARLAEGRLSLFFRVSGADRFGVRLGPGIR
jgi:hypothetical protein